MAHTELVADRNARSPNFTEEARFPHALEDCLCKRLGIAERDCGRLAG